MLPVILLFPGGSKAFRSIARRVQRQSQCRAR